MAEQLSNFWCSSWLGQAAAWCKPLWEVTLCPGVCPACSGTRARSGYPLPHPLAPVPVLPSISGTAVQATERGQVHIQELIQAKNIPLFCHIYIHVFYPVSVLQGRSPHDPHPLSGLVCSGSAQPGVGELSAVPLLLQLPPLPRIPPPCTSKASRMGRDPRNTRHPRITKQL